MNVTEIVNKYRGQLKWFVRQRVNSNEDAEDILQNIFYQLANADKLLLPVENVLAWLYTVARNQITDMWRKKKNIPFSNFSDDEDDSYIPEEMESILFNETENPEELYFRSLIMSEIETALAELPREQREVFEMTEIQGLSNKEISEQTGIPVNTLLSRKRYAVLFLRERLFTLYDELILK
jgi:RNA polymerase sigma factor (sigma-70 family)